jgi:hypothetical protein
MACCCLSWPMTSLHPLKNQLDLELGYRKLLLPSARVVPMAVAVVAIAEQELGNSACPG